MRCMIKFLSLIVMMAFSQPLTADTQSDWYASLSNKREAASVRVGDDQWNASDTDKPLPYRFKCGAVLHSTVGGLRLDLINVSIIGGIYAYGDIGISLAGNNVSLGGVRSDGNMLIYGYGSLSVSRVDSHGFFDNLYYGGVRASNALSICMGASVTVIKPAGTGLIGGDSVLVSASTVGVHDADGGGVYSHNRIDILGAAVAVSSHGDGLEAEGGGGVVIDGSVVNVFSRCDGIEGYSGISITHSYVAIASIVDGVVCYPIRAVMNNNAEVRFENSIVKSLSKGYPAIAACKVFFGEGDYYLVTDTPHSSAIGVDDVYVNGGNVRVCSPGEEASGVNAIRFTMDSGRLEFVDAINVLEFLKYDAAAAALYTGVVADGTIDVTSFMANFYSQIIVDAISNAKIGNLKGLPDIGITCETYTQNCGTVWCDLPKYGTVMSWRYRPVINGGSYKGWFRYDWSDDSISPLNSAENALKCVSYAVAGAKKYDKITQSWSGILPSHYGTGSLYADASGKLYFWVPESWNVPGGGSGGGSAANVDLEPYTPSGWSAPLAFSTGYYSDSEESTTFETANTIYAKIAFHNKLATSILKTFRVVVYADDELKYSKDINGLEAGYYQYVTGIDLGSFDVGTHTVKMVVDAGGAILELDEGNNIYARSFTVNEKKQQYAIRYHRNTGGTPEVVKTQWIPTGVRMRLLAIKNGLSWTRTGFVFKGWATSPANARAGKVWKTDWAYVKDGTTAGKVLDVWAVWGVAPGYYAIRFNKNDGSGAWRTVAFQHGKTKALPSCAKGLGLTRSGYAFVGWSMSAAKANAPGVPSNIWKPDQALVASPVASGKVLDVYAAWVKGYVVRYHKNTGESPEAIKTQGIASGVKTRLASLKNGLGWARTGFVLKGWATSPANARAGKVWKTDWAYVTDGAAAGKVLDVWAVWGVAPGYYAIRFNKNDKSGTKKTVAFPYGTAKALPTCAKGLGWTRAGYAFVGWSVSAAKANAPGVPSNIWKPDQAVVSAPVSAGSVLDVHASWIKGYTIRFHKNTGVTPEVVRSQGFQSGVRTRLPAVRNGLGWARAGFVFKGWATSKANAKAKKVWKTDWAYVTDATSLGKVLDVWAIWEGATAVGNDNFAYSRAISGSAGSVSASNKDATAERGEPLVKRFPYAVNSIWWSWTAPASGTVRFSSSGTSFDTVMGVYSGSSLAGLATIAEDDDGGGNATSQCSFTATAGTVYHIAVAGYNNDSFGTIRLSWEMPGLKTATVQIQPTTNLSVTMRRTPFAADDSLVYAAGVLPDDGGMYFLAFDRSTGEGTVRLECDGMAEEFACEVVYADFEEEGFVVLLEDGEWLSL